MGLGKERLSAWGGTDTVDLDGSLLLCHVLEISRERLYARLNDPVPVREEEEFLKLIDKRCLNYPVAYLTGTKEFFGRPFRVAQGVLCPRPDTEIIIEKALDLLTKTRLPKPALLDLCSGSGCIGLTMAAEIPACTVVCSDIAPEPAEAFEVNRSLLGVGNASFAVSDLFADLEGRFDMILTNPPYLTARETSERMALGWKEPPLALDGGRDGMDLLRRIIPSSIDYLKPGGYLLVEAAPAQMDALEDLMGRADMTEIDRARDLAGHERVIYGRKG